MRTAKNRNFNLRVRVQDLQHDDRVLLRNLGVPEKHKLADHWKPQPYVICKQLPGLPVYQSWPEGSTGLVPQSSAAPVRSSQTYSLPQRPHRDPVQ